MGRIKLIVCFMSLVLLSSCAHKNYVLEKEKVVPFKEFSKVTNFVDTPQILSLQLVDARENKDMLGMAKTGVSYTSTPLITPEGASVYLKAYFENALTQRGLEITDLAESELEIVINTLWVDELQEKFKGERAKCNVEIDVFAKKGLNSFKGSYWTKITSAGGLGDGTDQLAPTLASCLNEVVEKIVADQKLVSFIK